MNRINVILGILLLGVLGGAYGYYLFTKPVESLVHRDKDYTLEAQVLLNAFELNEEEANAMYLDKVIEVKGKILKVDKSEEAVTIHLETGNLMSSIICEMDMKNYKKGSSYVEGNTITIRGLCSGFLMDVVLVRAIVIE